MSQYLKNRAKLARALVGRVLDAHEVVMVDTSVEEAGGEEEEVMVVAVWSRRDAMELATREL